LFFSVPATSANMGPGFDTLGVALSLRNEVDVKRSKFFSVSIRGEGRNSARMKSGNIFVSIFNEQYKNITGKKESFRFEFANNIPISRGLGSSSATIISAVKAAYEMAGVEISKEKVLNIALTYEPHPDNITPAVHGGFNVAVVENARVFSVKKDMPHTLKAVVVIPNVHMSTNHSRGALPKRYSKEEAVFNISHSSLMSALLFSGNYEMLRVAAKDKFHQDIRMKNLPELFEVQRLALDNGALMSTLSGSGSSFFSMVYADDAERLRKILENTFGFFKVEIFDFDNDGLTCQKS
jgi:homoserine kinase